MSLSVAALAQNEVQQLFPCKDDLGNAVSGCIGLTLSTGQYAEVVKDTSYCSGDTLFAEYIAANSFLNVTEGQLIYTDTVYNGCNVDGQTIDSTRLDQDSILIHRQNGTIVDRDTIRLDGGGADGNGIYDGSGTVPTNTIATLTNSIRFDRGDGDEYFDFDLSGSNPTITTRNNSNPNGYAYIETFYNSTQTAELQIGRFSAIRSAKGFFSVEDFNNNDPIELALKANAQDVTVNFDDQFSLISDLSLSEAQLYSNSLSSNVQEWDLTAGDIFFPQYNTDKVITSQTNKYVSMIDTTNGQMFLIHPDSIGGAGGGGSADGNDFLTGHSVTGASGTNSRTLTSTVSNQPNVTANINVADADSSTTNEIQDLSIDSTASNGTFREFTISITDGNSVTFRDSIGSGGGGGSDGFLKLDSLVNTTNGSTERITLHFRDETDVQDSLAVEFTDDEGTGGGSDDQNISGSNLTGTDLFIGIENGTGETVDLSSIQDGTGTDDQTLSIDSTANSYDLSIESGNTVSWTKSRLTLDSTSQRIFTLSNGTNSVSWIDSVGEAGTTDGNDFVTSISKSEPTDSTVRLELNIPNQLDPSTTFTIADNDADPENEGMLSVGAGTNTTSLIQSNTPGSPDIELKEATNGTIQLTEVGNTITIQSLADPSTTNEIQDLTWSAGTGGDDEITLTNGGSTITITDNVNDADASTTNEIQDLIVSSVANGARVNISDSPEAVDFYGLNGLIFDDSTNSIVKLEIHPDSIDAWTNANVTGGTDDQTISTTGAAGNISIENGNTLNLNVDDADADDTNELQDFTISTLVSGDVRLGLTPISSNRNFDFRAGQGIALDVVPPGDVMEISADPKDTVHVVIQHTARNTALTDGDSDDFFVVPDIYDGYELVGVAHKTTANLTSVMSCFTYHVDTAGTTTTKTGSMLAGTSFIYGNFATAVSLSRGDYIYTGVDVTDGSGSDGSGFTTTLTLIEP